MDLDDGKRFVPAARLRWVRTLVFSTGVLVACAAQAAMTDYQREQITQYLHGPDLTANAEIFDGQAFNPAADPQEAAGYLKRYIDATNRAVREWNKLTSGATGSAAGQALLKELNEKLATAKAMQQAFPAFRAARAAQPATGGKPQSAPQAAPASSASGQGSRAPATPARGGSESGGMTDYQKEQLTRHLDATAMREDRAIFDGERFVDGVPRQDFETYYQGYMTNLEHAISAWERQIPSSAKSSPDGRAIFDRLKAAIAWGYAMRADHAATRDRYTSREQAAAVAGARAKQTAAADAAVHKQQCADFQSRAMTPLAREPMRRFVNQMLHGNAAIGSPASVAEHREIADAVVETCRSVDYPVLTSRPCWYVLGRPDHDPKAWCDAASNASTLLQGMALNSARQTIATIGTATIQSPEQFLGRDGWLTFEGAVTYEANLHFSAHGREPVMESVEALMTAVALDDAEEALWGEQRRRLDALREQVDATASRWRSPPNEADNYSTALVRKQITQMHGDAEVRDAYLGRESWKIHKNALGVPLRRTLPGYVIFKLPADPYCQFRSYTLTEQYSGGGQYQKAAGVRIGYVRFQDCS